MNRINPDSDYAKKCIESANDPVQKKRYNDQCEKMARNARAWRKEHPDANALIQFNYPPDVFLIAVISDAIKHKYVTVNDEGLDLIKALGDYGTQTEPSVAMVRVVIEHVYE